MYQNQLFSLLFGARSWAIAALLLFSVLGCQSPQTALKAIKKQEWDKAEMSLNKQLDNPKDSLFASAYYVLSLLYSDSAYTQYEVDTAYYFILSSTQDFEKTPEKERLKLTKTISLDSVVLVRQKRRLDSLAFGEARADSSVQAYQTFLDRHADAPQREEAIRLRNQLAFGAAQQMDTYQAYREFMDTYPAAEQYSQAEERFNTLVFQAQTKTGKLASYYQFLDAFPQSPYRLQAEQAIFSITTAANHLESYAAFISDFPNSPLTQKAVNWLYHLYRESHTADSFFITFPNVPFSDSLQQAQTVGTQFLLPYWENEGIGFIDASGKMAISPRFTSVLPEYLCQGVSSAQLFGIVQDSLYMTDKESKVLHSLATVSAELEIQELGSGLLWVSLDNASVLLHASGEVVISPQENVTEVGLLPGASIPHQFIKYQVSDQWGLKTFTGNTILSPAYDDISEYGQFIVLEQDSRLAITNRAVLVNQVADPNFHAKFLYEDVALLNEDFLLAYTEEYETVLDTTLAQVVPLEKHTVLHRTLLANQDIFLLRTTEEKQQVKNDSLITEQLFRYSLYPKIASDLPASFSQAYYNDQWLTLKHEQKYYLFNQDSASFSSTTYDSVKIVSEHFAFTFSRGDSSSDSVRLLIAGQNPTLLLLDPTKDEEFTFRLHRTSNASAPNSVAESILIDQPGQPSLLLTQTGDTVLFDNLDEVAAYPEGLYVIKRKGKQGMIDQLGNELLPVRYQRIGNYQTDGLISLFDRKKFGMYHPQTGTIIEPSYEGLLQYYSVLLQDSVPVPAYIAKKDGKFGIIDAKEQLLLPFEFQAIRYWNEQAALVKYNDLWHVYTLEKVSHRRLSFNESAIQYSDIIEFSELPITSEKLLKIYKDNNYGLLSNQQGEVLKPTFDDIRLIIHPQTREPMYLTEKYVSEARLHILIYMDAQGEIIFRKAYDPDAYDRLYCDE